ncbi:MAG: F0F1 ATP synthase subunit B [bacterium]|nr:F0F1 ATP synthase subunit B [bacterium]
MCVVLCASGVAEASGGEGFYPGDLGQAIATILIFGLLLFVLGKWAWGPIVKQLQDREQDVISTIEGAQKHEREAKSILQQYTTKMENADSEAEKIIAQAIVDADTESGKIIEAAKRKAYGTVQNGRAEIKRAKTQAIRDMRDATAQLATDIAGCILDESMTPQVRDHLVDASIKAIGERAAEDS